MCPSRRTEAAGLESVAVGRKRRRTAGWLLRLLGVYKLLQAADRDPCIDEVHHLDMQNNLAVLHHGRCTGLREKQPGVCGNIASEQLHSQTGASGGDEGAQAITVCMCGMHT